jgi:replication factor A1
MSKAETTNIDTVVENINNEFEDDVSEEARERVRELQEEYGVPLEEAQRTAQRRIATNYETAVPDAESVPEAKEKGEEEWLDLGPVKFTESWGEDPENGIQQSGILSDEEGDIKFTTWQDEEAPMLEKGETYVLENVVRSDYEDNKNINMAHTTEAHEVDAEIDTSERQEDNSVEFTGAIVDVQRGSGLIKRCPKEGCNRVLQNGRCSEHGEVEGEFDMRVKAVVSVHEMDNDVQVVLDRELVEELTGITMDEAIQEAMDALDTEVVDQEIFNEVMGRYYEFQGDELGDYVVVQEAELLV